MAEKFDVLIIGGGLVGASLLCALESTARAFQIRVGLIEVHDIDAERETPPSYDARASALSYGTRLIYEQLGLWQDIAPSATPILDIHVSDRGHFGSTHLNHKEEKVPALGYIVENHRLGEVLLQRLKDYREQQWVEVISPAEVVAIKPRPDACSEVTVRSDKNQSELQSKLVILADGGRSNLMDQLRIYRRQYDYEQYALITNVTLDQPHNGIAYERFSGNGPMALLPLADNRSAVVWTVPSEDIDQKMALEDQEFLAELQKNFGFRAGTFIKAGQRESYPLTLSVAQEQVRPGLVVLGNAAHALHPVAGQGYNLAIRDAVALADNIRTSLDKNLSPGNLSRLLAYVEKQKADQQTTLNFCDHLVKLFSRKELPTILARNLGLNALDMSRTLKSRFARRAMGL